VHDGVIIGEGWHEVYGEAHAEVNAINSALDYLAKNSTPASDATANTAELDGAPSTNKKPPLSDATIYVTLEPLSSTPVFDMSSMPCQTRTLMQQAVASG